MTPWAAWLLASTNTRWRGRRSGPTSAWPGMGSIHPSCVGDDAPLDVQPVRSICRKGDGVFKALRGGLGDQIGDDLLSLVGGMVGSPSRDARRAIVAGGGGAR